MCLKWKLLQLDFCIAQVMLMHKAPVILVIHFQAIPDAINTVSERRLIFHPKQDGTGWQNGENL